MSKRMSKRTKLALRTLLICALLVSLSAISQAQSLVLDLPDPSQAATISQRLGITTITINYHRPLVKDRKVWGDLVPYGKVWRAGANFNTIISFSDPVQIEGQPLPAGAYGLHMLPTATDWTVIFSKNSTSWGSFTYDQSEDALRVTVHPHPADLHNALTYDFDQLQPDSAVVTMQWEKLAVPFKVSVDTHAIVAASLKQQLRNLSQYTWNSWDDAANYLLAEKFDLEQALKYADKSIETEDRFDNEDTKAKVLLALNKPEEAAAAQKKALAFASPLQLHGYARQLLTQSRAKDAKPADSSALQSQAFAIFRDNATKHPELWFTHTGLARVYSAQANFPDASKEMQAAIAAAPANQKAYLDGLLTKLQSHQDIN